MPKLVDYDKVLRIAEDAGMRCGYPNGAAFVLNLEPSHVAGWSASADATVKPAWRGRVATVEKERIPYLALRAWRERFGGRFIGSESHGSVPDRAAEAAPPHGEAREAWLAPVHHWAAELQHGDGDWLAPWLAELGMDADRLRDRTRADAVSFSPDEAEVFTAALGVLLERLWKSDFTLLFPGGPVVCTVHHHGQLWWQCGEQGIASELLEMARENDQSPNPNDQ